MATSSAALLSTDDPRPSMKSPKSPPSALGKICIICLGAPAPDFPPDGDGRYVDVLNYSLLLLDLASEWDSSSYIRVNPTICFSSLKLGVDGCGVLFSNLYLFGSDTTDVFSFDLSSISSVLSASDPLRSSDPLILTEDLLGSVCQMNFPKTFPQACQTPDGEKLIVFSSVLGMEIGDFELFDGRKWTLLPDIWPIPRPLRPHVRVRSYSFIDNGPLLLIITEAGSFTLDIGKLPDSVWSKYEKFELPYTPFGVSMLIRGPLRLMDWFEWVDGTDDDPGQELPYPGLSLEAGSERRYGCGITWLSRLMNRFCVVRSHVARGTMQAHLIVDVCDFDDDDEAKRVVKKRIKFAVGGADIQWDPFFAPLSLCPLRKKGI